MEDKSKKKIKSWPIITIVALLTIYAGTVRGLSGRFLFNTKIGDYDVSLKTPNEAEQMIKHDILSDYQLSVNGTLGKTEYLDGNLIGLDLDMDLEKVKAEQRAIFWPAALFSTDESDLVYTVTYDEGKIKSEVEKFSSFQDENMEKPKDAYVSDYINGEGYKIIKEENGNTIMKDKTIDEIKKAVSVLAPAIDLEEKGCYETPKVKEDSESLALELKRKTQSVAANIEYEIGDRDITLDADTYHDWISFADDTVIVDEEAVAGFVDELARTTNTAYTERDFVTSEGQIVKVTGPYGYQIAKDEEKTQIIEDILSGEDVKREPVYLLSGASRTGNDYGNTYIEVDLTNQKVYLYVDGNLIKESSCVTGCVAKGNATPPGIFPMTYKQRDAVLRGPGYASPVKYWMPFNRGIGLHDASWRGNFGGTIYKTNGSHGCINLPTEMAKVVYENAYQGMPVICHE